MKTEVLKDWSGVGTFRRNFYDKGKLVGFYTFQNDVIGIWGFGMDDKTVIGIRKADMFVVNPKTFELRVVELLKQYIRNEGYVATLLEHILKDFDLATCEICGLPVEMDEYVRYKAHWCCWREKKDLTEPLFPQGDVP